MAELPKILDSNWNPLGTNIDYLCCECGAVISLEVFRSGQTFMHVEHPHLYPEVDVHYEEGHVFQVQSTHCDISVQFTIEGEGDRGFIMVDP